MLVRPLSQGSTTAACHPSRCRHPPEAFRQLHATPAGLPRGSTAASFGHAAATAHAAAVRRICLVQICAASRLDPPLPLATATVGRAAATAGTTARNAATQPPAPPALVPPETARAPHPAAAHHGHLSYLSDRPSRDYLDLEAREHSQRSRAGIGKDRVNIFASNNLFETQRTIRAGSRGIPSIRIDTLEKTDAT
jgi:hypothetical protein